MKSLIAPSNCTSHLDFKILLEFYKIYKDDRDPSFEMLNVKVFISHGEMTNHRHDYSLQLTKHQDPVKSREKYHF